MHYKRVFVARLIKTNKYLLRVTTELTIYYYYDYYKCPQQIGFTNWYTFE